MVLKWKLWLCITFIVYFNGLINTCLFCAEFQLRHNQAKWALVPLTLVGPRLPDTGADALLLLHSDWKENRIPLTGNLLKRTVNGCRCGSEQRYPKNTLNFWLWKKKSIAIFLSKLFTLNIPFGEADGTRCEDLCRFVGRLKRTKRDNADLTIWRIYSLSLIYVGGFFECDKDLFRIIERIIKATERVSWMWEIDTIPKKRKCVKTESFIQSACEFLNYTDQAIFKPYVHVLL